MKALLKYEVTENLPNIDKCTEEILCSELLNCPYCGSSNIQQKTKSDDECKDCGKTWEV